MQAIFGLGNPGSKYRFSRHNVGFMVADALAERFGVAWKRSWRLGAEYCRIQPSGHKVLLVKPRTFMNRSGQCASIVHRRHGILPPSMLVVVDDIDLPLGQLRIRPRGGPGTHNGLRSMEQALGSNGYARLRFGIGGRGDDEGLADHVLGEFRPEEMVAVKASVSLAMDAIERIMADGLDVAMTMFNQKGATLSAKDGDADTTA